jgi:ribose transport system substrate-binding protein
VWESIRSSAKARSRLRTGSSASPRRRVGGFLALSLVLALCALTAGYVGSAGATAPARTSTPSVDIAGVKSVLAAATKIPTFKAPGPAINIASAKGKTVFYLPLLMGVPIVQTWWRGVQQAAKAAGMKAVNFDPKGQASEMVRGMQQAINSKVAVIIIDSIESKALAVQIRQAQKAGIKVIVVNERNEANGGPALNTGNGTVTLDYAGAGKLEADWVIADSGGKAQVAVLKLPNAPAHLDMVAAIKGEFAKYCPKTCSVVSVQDVAAPDWPTRLPVLTQSLLTKYKNVNYMIPVVDAMSLYMVPAIKQAGAAGRVKISTFNGTPAVEKLVKAKNVVGTDIGGANMWESWAYVDQALRALTGNKPVRENIPLRVFDSTNIGKINIDETDQLSWYATSKAIAGYKKLWHVQ